MKTNIRQQAYQLFISGMSYGNISRKLGIGKTTAYDYVRDVKISLNGNSSNIIRNGSELSPNERSGKMLTSENNSEFAKIKTVFPIENTKRTIKEFTGDDLIKKKFDSLDFTGKFLELIGKPSKLFSGIIWGLPKGGKSNFSLRFADYLQEYFGEVVYLAAEEGESVTLQEKFKEIGGSKVTVAESRNREDIREYLKSKSYDFVFIDSINNAGIDSDYLEIIKHENPKKSFISIVQATKGGNFKGDQALTHNCDFIIKVVAGIAYHTGRFNTATEISIFDEPLYQKNPIEKKKIEPKVKKKDEKESDQEEDLSYLLSLLHGDKEKKKETIKEPPILTPSQLPKLNLSGLITSLQKNNLPTKQVAKPVYDLSAINEIDAKTGKALLKVAGGLILAKFLYEVFNPKPYSTQEQEEGKKKL